MTVHRRDNERTRVAARAIGIGALVTAGLLAVFLAPTGLSRLGAAEFLAFGLVVGAYGTMVGAGGGFMIVPALLLVYHARPEQAAGTSLAVVFLNALSGSASYARQKRIDYHAGWWFAIATLPGAIFGAYLAGFFSGPTFDLVFAVLLLVMSVLLIWRPTAEREYAEALMEEAEMSRWQRVRRLTDVGGEVFHYRYNMLTGLVLSFAVGFFSSILGIGGGIIHVPALIHLLGFPAHVATATSHFILAISAGVGAASHLALGHVLTGPAFLMGIGVVGGAQIGAWAGRRLQGSLMVRLLSLALIAVAIRLLVR